MSPKPLSQKVESNLRHISQETEIFLSCASECSDQICVIPTEAIDGEIVNRQQADPALREEEVWVRAEVICSGPALNWLGRIAGRNACQMSLARLEFYNLYTDEPVDTFFYEL